MVRTAFAYDYQKDQFVCPDDTATHIEIATARMLNERCKSIRVWLDFNLKSGRYSRGFLVDMVRNSFNPLFDPHAVYSEIAFLEGMKDRPTMTKRPRRMKAPLQDYWHKHYFQSSFYFRNLSEET